MGKAAAVERERMVVMGWMDTHFSNIANTAKTAKHKKKITLITSFVSFLRFCFALALRSLF